MTQTQEILNNLVTGKISLSVAMMQAKIFHLDKENPSFHQWLNAELDGYENKLSIPSYRQYPCQLKSSVVVPFYGEQVQPVDAREIDEDLRKTSGVSLYTMYVGQGIEPLEGILAKDPCGHISMAFPDSLEGPIVSAMSTPSEHVLHLYQYASMSYVQNTLSHVKNIFINFLMENNNVDHVDAESSITNEYKSAFVSYSWDSREHEEWVKYFADSLRGNGVPVYFDKYAPYGTDMNLFMRNGIKDADVILVIGTERYVEKVANLKSGVAFEDMIINDAIRCSIDTSKIIPILRSGSFETSFSDLIGKRKGVDFTNDLNFMESLKVLLNDVLKK